MADLKISALTASTTPLAGTEVLPIVQSSTTKQVSVANLTAGRAVTAASVTTTGEVKASGGLRVTGSYAANAANQVAFQNSAGVGAMYVNGATTGIGNLGTFVMWQQDSTGGNYLQTLGVDVTANVTVTSGNLVIGTSGKGIDFSATSSGSGTMTSELLADYEEGTWTPAVTPTGGGSVSYGTQSGFYTKNGRTVTVNAWIGGSTTSLPLGDVTLTGFPFAVNSNTPRANAYLACNAITAGGGITGQLSGYLFNSTMFVNIINNGSLTTLSALKINTNFEFYISFSYMTT